MTALSFPAFRSYVCTGDSVEVTHDGITYRARIEHDGSSGSPDKEQDGFWPSLDPKSDGFIGHKSKATLARHMKRAKDVLAAWENDEWFFCGVVISAHVEDDEGEEVELGDHMASLWGIECNYPAFTKTARTNRNAYLTECANEMLGEAMTTANRARQRIHEATA